MHRQQAKEQTQKNIYKQVLKEVQSQEIIDKVFSKKDTHQQQFQIRKDLKNLRSMSGDLICERSNQTITTKTQKIRRNIIQSNSSNNLESENTFQCLKNKSRLNDSGKKQALYAHLKPNTLEEQIKNKTEDQRKEEARILGDTINNPNFQTARTQQNLDHWNLDKYLKNTSELINKQQDTETPKKQHYKFVQQQSSLINEEASQEQIQSNIKKDPKKTSFSNQQKNTFQNKEGFTDYLNLIEEQVSLDSEVIDSEEEDSQIQYFKKNKISEKKSEQKQNKFSYQNQPYKHQPFQPQDAPIYPYQNQQMIQQQQQVQNIQNYPYLGYQQFSNPYVNYNQALNQQIPIQNQFQNYPQNQFYHPYQQTFQNQFQQYPQQIHNIQHQNQPIQYWNQPQQEYYQPKEVKQKKQKKNKKNKKKQLKNDNDNFRKQEGLYQQNTDIQNQNQYLNYDIPDQFQQNIEEKIKNQNKNIQRQLEKFEKQKANLKGGNKKHKDKVVVFLHQDQVLIVLFSSNQFQINGILGFFKKSQFYKIAKKNDSNTIKEEVYFQCEFEFFNRQHRNKYWKIQDKIYKTRVEREKIICQFIRRGEYILKAKINDKIFYRNEEKNFLNYKKFFTDPIFYQKQMIFQIGLYKLKVLFKEQKFFIELASGNNIQTGYTGMVTKLRKADNNTPKILYQKQGTKYKVKCLYKKFIENNFLYYVSYIEMFYFVYNQNTHRLFFYSSFVKGDATYTKQSNQLRQLQINYLQFYD